MMNLLKTKGAPGFRGHVVLYVLVGLLVSEDFSQAAHSTDEDASYLKLRLSSLRDRYKQLCSHYSSLAANCSDPGHSVLTCSECPDGWFQVEDQCFILITDRQDWVTSKINCTAEGGHLASLTTREQHEAVERESRRIGGMYTYYWIGLNDIEKEGEWEWLDHTPLKTSPQIFPTAAGHCQYLSYLSRSPAALCGASHREQQHFELNADDNANILCGRIFWDITKSEPDNHESAGEEGEDCAVVDGHNQNWSDVPCSFLYPRICQKEATLLH